MTADQLSRFPGIQLVESEDTPGRPARFTTRELLVLERKAVDLAVAGGGSDAPQPDRKTLLRALLQARKLTSEQRRLVLDASSSPDRVVCVVGAAGAGKTTAPQAVAHAHRQCELTVLGAAPSGRAADELEQAAGIPSRTLHRLLLDAYGEGGLPHRSVLVVDEAGMAETRALAPLLELVERAEGKAILVGDPAELPAVGAGGLYPALCERLCALELLDNRRQLHPIERHALEQMRHGEPEPYLAQAARRGRLQVADDPMAARQRLLEDWWQTAQPDLEETVMLVYRRADVRGLNDAAHVLMLRAGRLGPQAVELDEREFRVGDRASAIQEWGYVACTRARTETHLYLSEHDAIERETPLRDPDPAAPPVRAARALERAVAEPLALDRARQRHDANARLYSRRQEQLEQQRARSAERLANRPARAQTARLVERGGRRVELEREDHPSADRAPGLRRQAGRAAPNSVRVPARPTARS